MWDYLEHTDIFHIFGDFLSLLTISSCVYAKIPQIKIIHENKSAKGKNSQILWTSRSVIIKRIF